MKTTNGNFLLEGSLNNLVYFMKCLISTLIFVFFSFINCGGNSPERQLKLYNPEKAGATIVESFDITHQINIVALSTNFNYEAVYLRYDIAEYNNAIYILCDDVLYIFDKQTFTKINEITLNSIPHIRGLAITAGGDALLISYLSLYSLDLTTGNVSLIDYPAIDDIDVSRSSSKIGYDIEGDLIWLEVLHDNKPDYFFFTYDAEDGFIFLERKSTSYNATNSSLRTIVSIYGKICLFNGYSIRYKNHIYDIGIVKINLHDPSETMHFIDVEYLNTLTIPRSAHYDGEHIWLLVERNGRILMLKLLPHWENK